LKVFFHYDLQIEICQVKWRYVERHFGRRQKEARMPRKGKAPAGEIAGKGAQFSTRISQDLRIALEDAAAKSGRSLSQEFETRLRGSFAETPRVDSATDAIVGSGILGIVVSQLKNLDAKDPATARWHNDPYCWRQAVAAATTILNLYRPAGVEPVSYTPPGTPGTGIRQGESFVEQWVLDVQTATPAVPMSEPGKLLPSKLREQMGPALADRPEVFGMSSERWKTISRKGVHFGEVMRKARRDEAQYGKADPADLKQIRKIAIELQELIPEDEAA
jgi:hypothetical protein